MPAASSYESSALSGERSPGIAGSSDHAAGVGKSLFLFLSSTHHAADATRVIDTCSLPAVGERSDATVVLPYAAAVMVCACELLTPTDVRARSAPVVVGVLTSSDRLVPSAAGTAVRVRVRVRLRGGLLVTVADGNPRTARVEEAETDRARDVLIVVGVVIRVAERPADTKGGVVVLSW